MLAIKINLTFGNYQKKKENDSVLSWMHSVHYMKINQNLF